MNKKKTAIIGILLIILGICGCLYYSKMDKDVLVYDETKEIKEKYEALNGTVRESDKATYQNITIDETIEIDVLNAMEATKFIKEESGILFIGAPW